MPEQRVGIISARNVFHTVEYERTGFQFAGLLNVARLILTLHFSKAGDYSVRPSRKTGVQTCLLFRLPAMETAGTFVLLWSVHSDGIGLCWCCMTALELFALLVRNKIRKKRNHFGQQNGRAVENATAEYHWLTCRQLFRTTDVTFTRPSHPQIFCPICHCQLEVFSHQQTQFAEEEEWAYHFAG